MSRLEEEFVANMMRVGTSLFPDPHLLKMHSVLIFSAKPVAMDDLAKRTGLSLATVSNKIKLLEEWGMVLRTKLPGSRKIYFEGERDFFLVERRKIVFKRQSMRYAITHVFPSLRTICNRSDLSPEDEEFCKYLKKMELQLKKIDRLYAVVESELQ